MLPECTQRKPRLLIHCQYVYGIGHLARIKLLAAAATRCFEVYLVNGGQPVPRYDMPEGVVHIAIPAIYKEESQALPTPVDSSISLEQCLIARRTSIEGIVSRLKPDIVVTEHFPFGLLFSDEALFLLAIVVRHNPGAIRVSSVRDVIESASGGMDDERISTLLDEHFDALLVHSDERLIPLSASFPRAAQLQVPCLHTGFIARRGVRALRDDDLPLLVGSIGGGRVGQELLESLLAAHPVLFARWPHRMVLFRGAFQHTTQSNHCGSPTLSVFEFSERVYVEYLTKATLLVCMGGYNTVFEGLSLGIPLLVYNRPFLGRNQEQSLRCKLLAHPGRLGALHPQDLGPEHLTRKILETISVTPLLDKPIDFEGAERSANILACLVRSAKLRAQNGDSGNEWAIS